MEPSIARPKQNIFVSALILLGLGILFVLYQAVIIGGVTSVIYFINTVLLDTTFLGKSFSTLFIVVAITKFAFQGVLAAIGQFLFNTVKFCAATLKKMEGKSK